MAMVWCHMFLTIFPGPAPDLEELRLWKEPSASYQKIWVLIHLWYPLIA